IKQVQSKAIFYSAVVSQIAIFVIYYIAIYIYPSGEEKLGYLWLNFIGAMLTIVLSIIMQTIFRKEKVDFA
ncbi:MAG: sodium:solute symporter, partial [Flavobacteriaceae bacterium]|nr:sodium:solute symporter [Flavobacteriaceae bacterium]